MNHADQMELQKRIKEEEAKKLGDARHFAEYILLWQEVNLEGENGDKVTAIEAYERRYYGTSGGYRITRIDV